MSVERPSGVLAECFEPDWDDRFWSKVHPEALSGCWLWRGATLHNGMIYGVFYVKESGTRHGKVLAHRHAFRIAKGPIPDGLCVCHTCDVTLCVNPDHLWLGTLLDNIADRHRKGRSRGGQPRPEQRVRGERHWSSRLTAESVRDIRARHAAGERAATLAREYGINKSSANNVVHRRTWSHV